MKIVTSLIIGLLASVTSLGAIAAVEVGEVTFSRGVLTGQIDGEPPRLIGKGSPLHNGEVLNTGSRGFALILLDDGTRMTLRPSTTFKIEDVNASAGSENALFSLIRGGLRAITGAISKASANAFRINSTVATIGIRGTEFDARLCADDECQQEEQAIGRTAQRESRVVGRIAVLRGRASAIEDGRDPRALSVGAAVYERDQIQTGIQSYAVIAFNDRTRATLSPQSAFRIEEHEYKPEQPDENNSFLSFLQGGLRLVTGAISRLNQKAFRVITPTATIGIRGTGFDIVCQGACVDPNAMRNPAADTVIGRLLRFFLRPAYAQSANNGMFFKVWNGGIDLQVGNRTVPVENGRTAFLTSAFSPPVFVPDIPAALRRFGGAPRPDGVNVQPGLFSEVSAERIEPGMFVYVRSGDVLIEGVDGNQINLGGGEAGAAGSNRTVRLAAVPVFQKFDPIPDPARVTARSEKMMNLFGERGADKESMECTVQ